jgi:hypothetical protein
MNKQAHYWAAQEDRWHQQYLAAQKTIDELESKVWGYEEAFQEVLTESREPAPSITVIQNIVNGALRGSYD